MNLGLLIVKMQQLKKLMKMKPCKRCRLYFDPTELDNCPHCSELNDAALAEHFEQRKIQQKGHKIVGGWFYLVATLLGLALILTVFA